MHTLFVREHNRIALGLHYENPTWSSDRLLLEARKILGAVTQHITYNEWLPALFPSRQLVSKFDQTTRTLRQRPYYNACTIACLYTIQLRINRDFSAVSRRIRPVFLEKHTNTKLNESFRFVSNCGLFSQQYEVEILH